MSDRPSQFPTTLTYPPESANAGQDKEDESYVDYYYDEPGSSPGTLNIEEDAPPPTLVLIDYNESMATRTVLEQPEDCIPYLDTHSVSWIDVLGLGSEEILQRIGHIFTLHPLVLEDIVNVPKRPTVEEYEDYLLIVAWMVLLNPQAGKGKHDEPGFHREQVSFVLGRHYLLTVQEEPEADSFGPVRDRIRAGKGNIRRLGADYLAYALLDSIIDGFFPVLEHYGEVLEELEDLVVMNPTRKTLEDIHRIKRELLSLRRAIWPQRDAINMLIRDENPLIKPEVRIYLRDCYDHLVQVLDMVETYREVASSLMDVYLSSVSNKMNEIMKLLTVISSIFIPLTFIAGIYGMNFNTEVSRWNMPELNLPWGYPFCISLMVVTGGMMVYFFWKRGWFENVSSLARDD